MTLLIAILLIAGFNLHWILYPIAVILWILHLGVHSSE
jgi:hypothetical protein